MYADDFHVSFVYSTMIVLVLNDDQLFSVFLNNCDDTPSHICLTIEDKVIIVLVRTLH